jgi:hypothetical protein
MLGDKNFYGKRTKKYYRKKYRVKRKIPKQFPNTNLSKVVQAIISPVGAAATSVAASSFAANFLFGLGLSQLWRFIHGLQLIIHFPMLRIHASPELSFIQE